MAAHITHTLTLDPSIKLIGPTQGACDSSACLTVQQNLPRKRGFSRISCPYRGAIRAHAVDSSFPQSMKSSYFPDDREKFHASSTALYKADIMGSPATSFPISKLVLW